jgi:hypothetical protein
MNGQEVGRLLGLIALGDNRKPPKTKQEQDALIAWWLDKIGDLDYAACLRAVREHQRESTEYLTAAHIRQRVKDDRQAALSKAAFQLRNLRPPDELADDPIAERRWIDEQHARVAAGEQPQALEAGQ